MGRADGNIVARSRITSSIQNIIKQIRNLGGRKNKSHCSIPQPEACWQKEAIKQLLHVDQRHDAALSNKEASDPKVLKCDPSKVISKSIAALKHYTSIAKFNRSRNQSETSLAGESNQNFPRQKSSGHIVACILSSNKRELCSSGQFQKHPPAS